jgi:cysteine-rich repeat protein
MSSTRIPASIALLLAGPIALGAACGSNADDVFGEASASAGPGGGAGEGGDGSPGAGSTVGNTGATSTATGVGPASSSSGEGGHGGDATSAGGGPSTSSTTSSTSTGEGGAETSSVSSGDPSSTSSGAVCGDGVRNGDELCDGGDLGNETCASQGSPGNGELRCDDQCKFDLSQCSRCGNGALNENEDCDDGNTDPGDGCDAVCHFEGTSCQQPIEVVIDDDEVVVITTTNEAGDAAPGVCFDATGAGRVLRVSAESDGFLTAWVRRDGTAYDTSLRMGYGCFDTFVCADSYDESSDLQPAGGEVGSLFVSGGDEVFVFVEAWSPDDVGDFTVELSLSRGRCQEPVRIPVEPGSAQGIVAWGFNEGQGNDAIGTCGGSGSEVTYQLVPIVDAASPVDVVLESVEGSGFNPVLHVRGGVCDEQRAEIACAADSGFGGEEQVEGIDLPGSPTFVHADATLGSNGGFRLRVIPPPP